MREHGEKDPKAALKRVLESHYFFLIRGEDGGYQKETVARLVLEEMQARAEVRRKRNRQLGIPPKNTSSLFPTSLFPTPPARNQK